MHKSGPRIDPWGTPVERFNISEFMSLIPHIASDLLKANWSDFLLSQYVRKLSLHSVLLFFSNDGDP